MTGKDQALGILDRALSAATAAGCDGADAALLSRSAALTRFANNVIHQNVATEGDTLILRARRGKRAGVVHTGVLSDDGIAAAGEKAVEIAAAAPEDPELPDLVRSPPAARCAIYDEAAAACSPAERAQVVCEIIRRIEAGGAVASGSLATAAGCLAVANTAGTRQYDRSTGVELNLVAMVDRAAGRTVFTAPRLREMDAAARAEFALKKCLDSRGPAEIEPGEYAVVLEPPAVADMVRFLGRLGFNAMAMQQGRSCLQAKLGTKVCDERITLVDDARDPAGVPFPFDGEGVPTRRLELIAAGVAKSVVYDLRTAAKDGVESTGHGGAPPSSRGAFPSHMIMSPGDATLGEMIASTERGLLVSDFHYTNIADPSTCTITGMTRYGLFEIAGGKVARPVKNLRFTESVLRALDHVEAVGRDRERFGGMIVPALKINRFRFTGKSDH